MTITERLQFQKWRREAQEQHARDRMRAGQVPSMGMTDFGVNLDKPPAPIVFQAATGPSPIQMMLGGLALVAAGVIFTRNNR